MSDPDDGKKVPFPDRELNCNRESAASKFSALISDSLACIEPRLQPAQRMNRGSIPSKCKAFSSFFIVYSAAVGPNQPSI
jgi:hypothetical protein